MPLYIFFISFFVFGYFLSNSFRFSILANAMFLFCLILYSIIGDVAFLISLGQIRFPFRNSSSGLVEVNNMNTFFLTGIYAIPKYVPAYPLYGFLCWNKISNKDFFPGIEDSNCVLHNDLLSWVKLIRVQVTLVSAPNSTILSNTAWNP